MAHPRCCHHHQCCPHLIHMHLKICRAGFCQSLCSWFYFTEQSWNLQSSIENYDNSTICNLCSLVTVVVIIVFVILILVVISKLSMFSSSLHCFWVPLCRAGTFQALCQLVKIEQLITHTAVDYAHLRSARMSHPWRGSSLSEWRIIHQASGHTQSGS